MKECTSTRFTYLCSVDYLERSNLFQSPSVRVSVAVATRPPPSASCTYRVASEPEDISAFLTLPMTFDYLRKHTPRPYARRRTLCIIIGETPFKRSSQERDIECCARKSGLQTLVHSAINCCQMNIRIQREGACVMRHTAPFSP